jgi:hypothetical protein
MAGPDGLCRFSFYGETEAVATVSATGLSDTSCCHLIDTDEKQEAAGFCREPGRSARQGGPRNPLRRMTP